MEVEPSESMRWPANLSFVAAGVTAAVAVVSLGTVSSDLRRWVLFIAIPPIAGSLAQAVQYRRGRNAGGFWPVAIYLFFIVSYFFAALGLYFFGAILQTMAWLLGRRAKVDGRSAPDQTANALNL